MPAVKSKRTVKVNEGDWYAVPLRTSGYGVGVVTRKGRGGVLFGYFFGPRRENPPTIEDVRGLCPADAALCEMFGDLGIQCGEWPYVGRLESWNRDDWPLPEFSRIPDEEGKLAWIVCYEDKDVSKTAAVRKSSLEEARRFPSEGFSGYGAVEIVLTKQLRAD